MDLARIPHLLNRVYASRKATILCTASAWFTVLIALHCYNLKKIGEFTPHLLEPLQAADSVRAVQVGAVKDSTVMTAALAAQYEELAQYKEHHLRAATLFNQNYYACAFTMALGTIVVGLCALLIAKRGWDQTHDAIRVSFLVNSLAATMALSITQVYDSDENVDKNVAVYLAYEKLQIDIHGSLITDRPYHDSANYARQKDWAGYVNDQIRNAQAFFVDIDVSGIPTVPVGAGQQDPPPSSSPLP